MYLIDTSIWIDYLKEKQTVGVEKFIQIIESKLPFTISSVIYQEILQGAATKNDFEQLVVYLKTQRFVYPQNKILSYQEAAKIYFECRKNGITIRSTIDCLIAQIALEHDLILLHNDSDYERIHKIFPRLKLA